MTILPRESLPLFDGTTFSQPLDGHRLGDQLAKVRAVMADGQWRTLYAISAAVGAPEQSVSARLRDLRKERFGGYDVRRRRVAGGVWEYAMSTGERRAGVGS